MHIFARDRLEENALVTPLPLLREAGAIVGEFNGNLDSENLFPGTCLASNVELDGFGAMARVEELGAGTVSFGPNTSKGLWRNIGDAVVGETARYHVSTRDELLYVSYLARFADSGSTPDITWYPRQVRILVDGSPRAVSPQMGIGYEYPIPPADGFLGYVAVQALVPVGPGGHDVVGQMRVYANDTGAAMTIGTQFSKGRLVVRGLLR